MEVYRITHKKWTSQLTASGFASRWNSNGFFVIYTSESRSLSCLENLVHRNGCGNNDDFCIMIISIPNEIDILEISPIQLPKNWNGLDEKSHLLTRNIGNNWVHTNKSCILKVPSAIIPKEYNILINPNHKDFTKILIKETLSFKFDYRLI